MGPVMIKEQWIMYAIGGLTAYIFIRICVSQKWMVARVEEILWNALFLFVAVWKLSYTLFHPIDAFSSPLNQLYFTGGEKGVVLAFGVVMLYLIFRVKKDKQQLKFYIEPSFIALLTAFGSYQLLTLVLSFSAPLYAILQIVLTVILVVYWFVANVRKHNHPLWPGMILWFSLGSDVEENIACSLSISARSWENIFFKRASLPFLQPY
ncbi:hypothetical protein EV207_14622 [Scopulibacillus darangshiensis]|uniref:Prolipoprotein diacylglyceryl transferase n=1 Tax=Scopulibacillus darangshiensis TaxID=442528 RepID=A0A4R2NIH8_9BACL|nr:hypothetical protein [Scopulibacillus darangshiensis]TCP21072.1 hypothetical protein EV207_14622 [Scopulibacillus darangshiensis]